MHELNGDRHSVTAWVGELVGGVGGYPGSFSRVGYRPCPEARHTEDNITATVVQKMFCELHL